MLRKGVLFWDLGKQLGVKKDWQKDEFVVSPSLAITDTCFVVVKFYPAGLGDKGSDQPSFEITRNQTDQELRIMDWDICHGITLAKKYHGFRLEEGKASEYIYLKDIQNFSRFKIFHSLPDVCVRFTFCIENFNG